MKGFMGLMFNVKLQKMQKNGYRCQLIEGERLGGYIEQTQSYDGLLGRLQLGVSQGKKSPRDDMISNWI